jgi:hypothetical protein
LRQLRLLSVALALASLGSVASAQFASFALQFVSANGYEGVDEDGNSFELFIGKEITVEGKKIVVTKETMLAVGRTIIVDGKRATVRFRPYVEVGAVFSVFSIAGPIQQSDDSFLGGTKSVSNTTFTLDASLNRVSGNQPRYSIGGWYFLDDPAREDSDLYQVHVRGIGLDGFGGQIAYINSTTVDIPAVTLHALYVVDSSRVEPQARTPWSIELGLGTFIDLAAARSIDDNSTRPLKTLNFSTFTQGKLRLTERVSLTGTVWFVRDRNTDFTRLAVGLAYRF